jgi:hypothetical protein
LKLRIKSSEFRVLSSELKKEQREEFRVKKNREKEK